MGTYSVKLLRKELAAENTPAFFFEKPEEFAYTAGQFLRLTLPALVPENGRPNVRPFSIASAPYEPHLQIAIRQGTSDFKRVLAELPIGSQVQIAGPYGRFTLGEDPAIPAVFLAGGIGVTPMRSIILEALHEGKSHQLFLFYSNRRPEDAAFLQEFQDAQNTHQNFILIPTMTAMETSTRSWNGHQGPIDAAMIREHLPDLKSAIYFIAGPSAMVLAMREMLKDSGVAEQEINIELFSGY